jgi:hypothetical protein
VPAHPANRTTTTVVATIKLLFSMKTFPSLKKSHFESSQAFQNQAIRAIAAVAVTDQEREKTISLPDSC